jgi:hypothetical protein
VKHTTRALFTRVHVDVTLITERLTRPLVLWRHSVEGADSRRFTLTGMVRHCGGAAVRLRLTDHAQANPPAFLGPLGGRLQGREATHEATGTRSPSWRLRASLALPAALAGRRLGPLALPPAMASWPPVCSLGRSRNCSHVRSNKRGEAMPYGRRAARGVGGVTRLGLHAPRRGARPCYRRRRAMRGACVPARRGRLGCFML